MLAPEITKNDKKIGGVNSSTLARYLSQFGLRLAYVAPNIIQTNKADKLKCIDPILKFILDSPTHNSENAISKPKVLARDLNAFDISVKSNPAIKPIPKERTISSNGVNNIAPAEIASPESNAFASANEIENIINPIASSNATTGSNVFTTGPLA